MQILDAVLGLSVTPTTVGWVLAEGHSADGTILDHQELKLRGGPGVRAVGTTEQVTEEVLRVNAVAAASDHRLRVIGVTWNDAASAQAALLLESLTDAGFDNVVPIRMLEAVDTLAQAIAPVIGYEQTAVCILEQEWATVVMVDTHDGQTQTAVKKVRGGLDGLTSWLTGMFDRNAWRPAGVVVVGSDGDIDAFSWQLEKALPVPVFGQSMAQVTIARGAALAAAQSTEFTDEQLVDGVSQARAPIAAAPPGSRQLSYTGAATALAAGAVTFVASLSLAVGLQLAPDQHSGTSGHMVHTSTPQVAEAVTPAVPSPPGPEPQASRPLRLTSDQPAMEPGAGDPNGRPPSRRVLEHIPGAYDAPAERPPQP